MKEERFFRFVLCFLFIFFIVSMTTIPCSGQEPVVRLGYLQSDLHELACFVALEKKYFDQEGVKIEIGGIFRAGPEEMSAFAAGSLDVGYLGAAPVTVAVANKVAKVKIIAQANLEGSGIVVRKDSGIKSIDNLVGKVVTVPGHCNVQDCLLRMALKNANIEMKSVNIMVLKPPEMIPALETKQIDAFIAWEPYIAKAVTKGVGEVLLYSGKIWPKHPCCVVVVDEKFLDAHPKTILGVLRAHVKATRFIKENPDEAAMIGTKYTGMDLETVKLGMKGIVYEYVPNVDGELEYVKFLKEMCAIKVEDPDQFVKEIIDVKPINQVLK